MDMNELVAIAKVRSGKNLKTMAKEMGHRHATRISKLSLKQAQPTPRELAYIANQARMPLDFVFQEIEGLK